MSLFEKLKNKRYDLQEAIDDKGNITPEPGDKAIEKSIVRNIKKRQVKISKSEKKNISKNKAAGDKLLQDINKRKSADLTRADAINRAMGSSGSTEGSAGAGGTATKTKTVNQADVSKKAQKFTKEINKKNKNRTFFDPEKAKESRKNLIAKRKEYGIDRKGNISDAGVERYAKKTKQLSSGSNIPAKITKADKDLAKKRAVGGEKITNKSGKVIGTTTGKYGGKLSRARNKNMPSYDQVKAEIDNKEFYKKIKKTKPKFTNRLTTNKPNVNRNSASYYKSQGKDAFNLTKNPIKTGKPSVTSGKPELPKFNKTDNPSFLKKLKPKKLQTVRSYGDPRDIVKTYKPAAAKKFGSKLVKGLSKLGPKGKAAAAVVGLGLGAYALTKAKFGKKKDGGAGAGTGKTTKKNPSIQLNLGKDENKQT